MKRTDWFRLLFLSLLWDGSFLFYRMLAAELPPLTTVFSRVAIGGVAVLVALRVQDVRIIVPRDQWGRLAVMALLNNVIPFSLFAWGETRVSGGTASILNALTPMAAIDGRLMARLQPPRPSAPDAPPPSPAPRDN